MATPTREKIYATLYELLAKQYGVEFDWRFEGEEEVHHANKNMARSADSRRGADIRDHRCG